MRALSASATAAFVSALLVLDWSVVSVSCAATLGGFSTLVSNAPYNARYTAQVNNIQSCKQRLASLMSPLPRVLCHL
jgi:hypothetical protein